MSIGTW